MSACACTKRRRTCGDRASWKIAVRCDTCKESGGFPACTDHCISAIAGRSRCVGCREERGLRVYVRVTAVLPA